MKIKFILDAIAPLFLMASSVVALDSTNVQPQLENPYEELLNLSQLSLRKLTGSGTTIGIIEVGFPEHILPNHKPTVRNADSTKINSSFQPEEESKYATHAATVLQVVKQFSPDSAIFALALNTVVDGVPIKKFSDAIEFAVRRGCQAINLSAWSSVKGYCDGRLEILLTDDFLNGINFALRAGVPVFYAAGNGKEILEDDGVLKQLWANLKYIQRPELFFFVGGYDWTEEVFHRDHDVFLAEASARSLGKGRGEACDHFVTGPFRANVLSPVKDPEHEKRKTMDQYRRWNDSRMLRTQWFEEVKEVIDTIEPIATRESLLTSLEAIKRIDLLDCREQNSKNLADSCMQLKKDASQTVITETIDNFIVNINRLHLEIGDGRNRIPECERRKIKFPTDYPAEYAEDTYYKWLGSRDYTYEQEEVLGTSFAAPAVASVYLRLLQFSKTIMSESGIELTSLDLALAMKASCFEKGSEFGCGMIDGDKAMFLCEKLIQARMGIREREAAPLWIDFMKNLGHHIHSSYFFELYENNKEGVRGNLESILSLYPSTPGIILEDRIHAVELFFQQDYKNCLKLLREKREKVAPFSPIEKALVRRCMEVVEPEHFKKFH